MFYRFFSIDGFDIRKEVTVQRYQINKANKISSAIDKNSSRPLVQFYSAFICTCSSVFKWRKSQK